MLDNAGYGIGVPSTKYQPACWEDMNDHQFLQLLDQQVREGRHEAVREVFLRRRGAVCGGLRARHDDVAGTEEAGGREVAGGRGGSRCNAQKAPRDNVCVRNDFGYGLE